MARAAIVPAFAVAAATAACGSGAVDDGHGQTTPGPPSYAWAEATSAALHATWDSAGLTDPATLPSTGSAGYAGIMRVTVQQGAGATALDGALALNVSFSAATVSGTASGFIDPADTRYAGVLTLTNGTMDRGANPATGYTFAADLAGTLTGAGQSYGITADLLGDFAGPAWGAVTGVVAGAAVSGFGNGFFIGSFIAAR